MVWAGLHAALNHTRWGVRLRAATLDRNMLSALGVNPKPLMAIAVTLGCALAGLGGPCSCHVSRPICRWI